MSVAAQTSDTLLDAARRNDYTAFATLYAQEASPSRTVRDLHEVWTFAITDRTGAFYGGDTYNELVSAHPGFAEYIQEFAVDDSNGNRFYPAAETKKFLIEEMERSSGAAEGLPATEQPAPGEVAGRSTGSSQSADAFANDISKLGDFPAPPRRISPRPIAPAQIFVSTESSRGIFFIIAALIAAGVGIITLRVFGERID